MQTLITEQQTMFFPMGQELPNDVDYLWLIISGVIKTYTYGKEKNIKRLHFAR